MRAYVRPQQVLSRAMDRIAAALEAHAPEGVEIVEDAKSADMQLLYVVGSGKDAIGHLRAKDCAVMQCCLRAVRDDSGENVETAPSVPSWSAGRLIWSFLDLSDYLPRDAAFYHSPLGVDPSFRTVQTNGQPRDLALSSGYVSGYGAEAIEEFAWAAHWAGLLPRHLGPPQVEGMRHYPHTWQHLQGVSDDELSYVLTQSAWVSGLRYIEGFELPVVEGLACGARPIVFDRPDMRLWFEGHAVFVQEDPVEGLTERLTEVMAGPPEQVTEEERRQVLETFDWRRIAGGFWDHAQEVYA